MMSRYFTCQNDNQEIQTQYSRTVAVKAYKYDRLVREGLMALLLIFPYWAMS